ncbi:HK97-gp10 family putative phage morphogenesis protein [Sporosarcina sp. SAFN-010]|uniref:HK97-gp10 family putative phage morphogenesis protein n=1 Tax=Sporosarcina sp. SAFN-010 TaxID=3387273 RepID=UPI003F7EF5C7
MAGNNVKVGNRALANALKKYGDSVIDDVKRIITETAYIIMNNAKVMAPVDDGNLRDSIEVEIVPGGMTAIVRVTANYAIYVEYGTGIYAVEGNGRKTPWTYYSDKLGRFVTTEGMKPQPFWDPAIEKGQRHFRKEMRKIGR